MENNTKRIIEKNSRTIYFDMDGTIADLYQGEWLQELRAEIPTPYERAGELGELPLVIKELGRLKGLGYKIGVVSWLSKRATKEYKEVVRVAKKNWLEKHFPIELDEKHFVQYGTRKDYVVKDKKGLLFDDDERVRSTWKGIAIDPTINSILEILKGLN